MTPPVTDIQNNFREFGGAALLIFGAGVLVAIVCDFLGWRIGP